ncbi:MAG: alpha-hydroxy-acid oxidizing protein [Deltaproteobacteria bacterium]|jgi:hypothetical protein|nr:alpha-hydroxy-acid oxidizing protein [Deltaproteobacteria bacterium]
MQEIRKKARERVKAKCRVCPVCNGVACAGEIPGMGGIGSGVSFQNNVAALARLRLALRVLHDANQPDAALTLWGRELSMPIMAAPVGSVALNLGSDMSDEGYSGIVLRGCLGLNVLGGVGDLPLREGFQKYMDVVARTGAGRLAIPFIKPWSRLEEVTWRMDAALKAGCDICGMDVDGAGLPTMRNARVPVSTTPPAELAKIIAQAHQRGLKFIVKGIMTPGEAIIAADSGADAIVVSNHGGRVLDCTPGTAEVLPSIAEAVRGRLLIMMDGGVRSGADTLKALALGAEMVLICRPVMLAVHGDEENGLSRYFLLLKEQLIQAMRLTGCPDLKSVDREALA